MTTNSPSIDRFVDELRADPQYAEFADRFYADLSKIDRLADDCPDHAAFLDGLKWIWEKSRPLGERLVKIGEFMKLEGHPVVVDLEQFTGWR
jgi:hypothetical protein